MNIGYARVSGREQNLRLQLAALAGCDKIFDEKVCGASRSRPELDDALSHLRQGDTLTVWKLDRLGRTVKQLVAFVEDLQQRGIEFRSLTEGIDTSTPAGRFFFHMMAALAEMERDLIRERTRAGLDAARAQGLVGGRKRKINNKQLATARLLLEGGKPPKEVAATLSVSVATLYRYVPNAASLRQAPSSVTALKGVVRKPEASVSVEAMDVLKRRPQRRKQPA